MPVDWDCAQTVGALHIGAAMPAISASSTTKRLAKVRGSNELSEPERYVRVSDRLLDFGGKVFRMVTSFIRNLRTVCQTLHCMLKKTMFV
jgi:hypothetical protein